MERELGHKGRATVRILAVALTGFVLVAAISTFARFPIELIPQCAIMFFFAAAIVLLTIQPKKSPKAQRRVAIYDIVAVVLLLGAVINVLLNFKGYLTYRVPLGPLGAFFAVVAITLALETCRRTGVWVAPIFVFLLLGYALMGPYIPGMWGHLGFSFDRILSIMYQSDLGLWGLLSTIMVRIVALFLVFGAILFIGGGGETFIKLALLIAGRLRGGPALVAVISSALFGMVSGSSIANTAMTGNFTIPLMKRVGYTPEFAGAVEATASCGGQFTPPILAAVGFVMAEIIGVSYLYVIVLTIVPALIYYTSIFAHILLIASKERLAPTPPENIPKVREVITWQRLGPLLLPIGALIGFMLVGWSISFAAFWACVVATVLYLLADFSKEGMRRRVVRLLPAMETGGMLIARLAVLIVALNLVVSLLALTGLGVKLSWLLLRATEIHILLPLLLTAVTVIILGMGMPTIGAYVIGLSVCGTALFKAGFAINSVHMFIFYYAALSGLTPPVCVTVFTAAAISQGNWLRTATISLKLALVGFIALPFLFFWNPALLIWGYSPAPILLTAVSGILAAVLWAVATSGHLRRGINPLLRMILFACGVGLFSPDYHWRLIALAIGLPIVIYQFGYMRWRSKSATVEEGDVVRERRD